MKDKKILAMRLEGMMQSWGTSSRFYYRETDMFPSKSGVMGLIGAAAGIRRKDRKTLVELCGKCRMAVRADRPGEPWVDFQTVSQLTGDVEYISVRKGKTVSEIKHYEHGKVMVDTDGGTGIKDELIVMHKVYLADASFLVALETDEETAEYIRRVFESPVYALYLGRKNCPPSVEILPADASEYGSLEEVMKRYPLAERTGKKSWDDACQVMYEVESTSWNSENYRRDEMEDSLEGFTLRPVRYGMVEFAI